MATKNDDLPGWVYDLIFLIGCFTAVLGVGYIAYSFAEDMRTITKASQIREAQRQERLKTCKLHGYYGRHGEHMVYNCDGAILRDVDL